MTKHSAVNLIEHIRGQVVAIADRLAPIEPRLGDLGADFDRLRAEVTALPDDEEETILLSPALIKALEAQGIRQGEGNPPTKSQMIKAVAAALGVEVQDLPMTRDAMGMPKLIENDKRPPGWTEAKALEFIGTIFISEVDQFAKAFNEGAWDEVQEYWPEFQEWLDQQ